MAEYEYGRIKILANRLEAAGIAPEIAAEIMAGGDSIKKGDKPREESRLDAGSDEPDGCAAG